MSGRPTFGCVCTTCGWRSKRALKNVSRACPKCGGPVIIPPGEDRNTVIVSTLIATAFAGVLALIIAAIER